MNRRITIFFIVTLCVVPILGLVAVGAEEVDHKWQEYMKDGRGLTYYYDKESITFPSGGIIKLWRKREFPVRAAQKTIMSLDEIDCYKQKYRSVQMQVAQWNEEVETFSRVQDWMTIWGDTPEEWFLDNTCKEVRTKK
ncbi:MAG: hypothetical protein LBQ00_08195 [Syntrophobacterales bacterium]|jgi:hypothetical protein|nr:hypothetical protein [Syntrophobacterales bacterium]